jgi:hypothetical protein
VFVLIRPSVIQTEPWLLHINLRNYVKRQRDVLLSALQEPEVKVTGPSFSAETDELEQLTLGGQPKPMRVPDVVKGIRGIAEDITNTKSPGAGRTGSALDGASNSSKGKSEKPGSTHASPLKAGANPLLTLGNRRDLLRKVDTGYDHVFSLSDSRPASAVAGDAASDAKKSLQASASFPALRGANTATSAGSKSRGRDRDERRGGHAASLSSASNDGDQSGWPTGQERLPGKGRRRAVYGEPDDLSLSRDAVVLRLGRHALALPKTVASAAHHLDAALTL